jgi:hypothetical protein
MTCPSTASDETLNPPVLTNDGFITRESMYDFLGQCYEGPSLRYHAGGLFLKMVRAAMFTGSTIGFNVTCHACRRHVREYCPVRKHAHTYMDGAFSIEVASIKQYADQFVSERLAERYPVFSRDFQLLLHHL